MANKEFESVTKQSPEKRYKYFIKKVADYEEIWGLYRDSEGWAISKNLENTKCIELWPSEAFAMYCAEHKWINYTPTKICIYEFIENWIPNMIKNNELLSIFSNNIDSYVVGLEDFRLDLEEELERY